MYVLWKLKTLSLRMSLKYKCNNLFLHIMRILNLLLQCNVAVTFLTHKSTEKNTLSLFTPSASIRIVIPCSPFCPASIVR